MRRSLLGLSLTLVLLAAPALAKPQSLSQSRWNAQLQCQDSQGAVRALGQLVEKYGGKITNMNCDTRGGSGQLSARIPEDQLSAFCEESAKVGTLINQSRSLSDNNSSYTESKRQLELSEKMLNAKLVPAAGTSDAERALFDAEFKAYLRDRINGQRNSMAQYEQSQGWAEISVNLQGPAQKSAQPQTQGESPQALATPSVPQEAAPVSQSRSDWTLLFGAACLMGCTAVYLVRRPR